jgi:hypothetical protein
MKWGVAVAAAAFLSQACGSDRATGVVTATPTPTAVHHEVSFAPPVSYPVPQASWGIFAADFDHDGRSDIAFYSAYVEPTVSILHNLGGGTFHENDIPWKDVSGLVSADFDRRLQRRRDPRHSDDAASSQRHCDRDGTRGRHVRGARLFRRGAAAVRSGGGRLERRRPGGYGGDQPLGPYGLASFQQLVVACSLSLPPSLLK